MKLKGWQIVALAVAAGAAIWLYKRHNDKIREEAEAGGAKPGEMTGEYGEGEQFPYSVVGAGGPGGIAGQESQAAIREFEQEQKAQQKEQAFERKEEQRQQQEQFANLARSISESAKAAAAAPAAAPVTINLGSGGGAPSEPTGGTTVTPPMGGQPRGCPSDFPDYNPADGPVGAHSCYKYSRDRCPPPRIYKHVYQDGHVVCSPT